MPVIGPPPAGTTVSLRIVGGTTSELDLTQYMVLVEGEGFDPAYGTFLEPVFNDSAVGAGQGLVNIETQNKEFTFPLHLKSATKDGLHTLVRTLRLKLSEPQVYVEWRDQGAASVTYYDIEFARFDPEYRFHRARHNWVRGNLRCWVRPYGHTATERIVGTAAGTTFMQLVSVPSIGGDERALVVCDITSASQIRDLYGMAIVPSGVSVQYAASDINRLGASSSIVGASGAVASAYRGIHITASRAAVGALSINQASLVGNQRLFAVARTPNMGGVYFQTRDTYGQSGPTAFLGATYPLGLTPSAWQGWQLVDLGPVYIPKAEARGPVQTVDIYGSLASFVAGSLAASPGLHISAMYVLPEDRTTVVIDQGLIFRWTPAKAKFNGTINETYEPSSMQPYTGYQRGGFQTVAPGNGEQVAAFSLGRAANDPLSVTVRVREQFSFQR